MPFISPPLFVLNPTSTPKIIARIFAMVLRITTPFSDTFENRTITAKVNTAANENKIENRTAFATSIKKVLSGFFINHLKNIYAVSKKFMFFLIFFAFLIVV